MELPQQYWPVKVCPHVGQRPHRRLMFADYGSHENVNLSIDEEKSNIKLIPQKQQGDLKGLASNLPSLPLFDTPFSYKPWQQDDILGLKGLSKTVNDLIYLVKVTQRFKGYLRNNPKSDFAKKFRISKDLIKQGLNNQDSGAGTAHLTDEDHDPSLLNENLSKGIRRLCDKYVALTKAHNDNCLKGYNRDFYGGLVAVTQKVNGSGDVLVHAGKEQFKDIYITDVEEDGMTGLKHPKIQAKLTVDSPVYQVCVSSKQEEKVLTCVRQRHHCTLLHLDGPDTSSIQHEKTEALEDVMTSVSFSPYLNNELLLSTENGVVYLWDINSRPRRLFEKPPRFKSTLPWSCAYFGGHPRQIVVSDNSSVDVFDHRTNFSDGVELFSLSPRMIKPEERVMAAASLGFPYHAVATDYSLFVMDQRYGTMPVLQWSPEFVSAPQYIQTLQHLEALSNIDKMVFLASQQPAEIMCYSVGISNGCAPVSPVLPWKVSQIREFCQGKHTSYTCDLGQIEKRFEAPLAGFAVSQPSTSRSFTVYQMDSYGDLFYQTFNPDKSTGQKNKFSLLKERTECERQAADTRAGHWLKNLDILIKNQQGSNCKGPTSQIDRQFFKAVFTRPDAEEQETENHSPPSEDGDKTAQAALHRNLKSLDEIPCEGSSAQLHLALRKGNGMKEILEKRENDHVAMRKKLREKNLKERDKKSVLTRRTKLRTPGQVKSKEFISSSDEAGSAEGCEIPEDAQDTLAPGSSDVELTAQSPQNNPTSESSVELPTQRQVETPVPGISDLSNQLQEEKSTFDDSEELDRNGSDQILPYRIDQNFMSSKKQLKTQDLERSPKKPNVQYPDRKQIPDTATKSNKQLPGTEATQLHLESHTTCDSSSSLASSELSDLIPFQHLSSQNSNSASQPTVPNTFSPKEEQRDITPNTERKLEVEDFKTSSHSANVDGGPFSSPYVCASTGSVSLHSVSCFPLLHSHIKSSLPQQTQFDAQTPNLEPNVAATAVSHRSPSLFSSASGAAEAASKLTWDVNKSQELSSSAISPHRHVVKWLLQSVTSNPSTPAVSPDKAVQVKNSQTSTNLKPESESILARNRLDFDKSPSYFDLNREIIEKKQKHYDSESDNSSLDSEPSVLSSLHSVISSVSKSTPKMRHLADPSLAGFLSSPKNVKQRKRLKLKKRQSSNALGRTEKESLFQSEKQNITPSSEKQNSLAVRQTLLESPSHSISSQAIHQSLSPSKSSKSKRKKAKHSSGQEDHRVLKLGMDLLKGRKSSKKRKRHENK